MIIVAMVLLLVVGPLLTWLLGFSRTRGTATSVPPWPWRTTIASALLYVLAFNLTFFIQELFLVLPKAFTPGLRPTLFHNNHHWDGNHPLALLFQGTGVVAIFITGVVALLLLRANYVRTMTRRLFLFWMAFSGLFESLPQIVIGAMSSQSDVGMAMNHLQLSMPVKNAAAVSALIAIPVFAWWLVSQIPGIAANVGSALTPGSKSRYVFRVATVPALLAIPLIILFRISRELIEVVLLPIVVTVIGTSWMQSMAWTAPIESSVNAREITLIVPLACVALLLFVFQVLLRPGVPFF